MNGKLRPLGIGALVALALLTAPAARADHSELNAQWHLDSQSGGLTPDSSGHNLTGQDVAGSFGPGRFGDALTTTNANEGFRVINNPLLQPQRMTVLAWVKKGGPFAPHRQILGKGGGGCSTQSYGLSTGANGGLWWNVLLRGPGGGKLSATTLADAVAPSSLWNDQWHAIAGTFDGSSADLWVDGAKVASAPVPVAGSTVDYEVTEQRLAVGRYTQDTDPGLGACDPNGFQFRGAIDEVRIYNRALSAGEIAFLHRADQTTPPALPEASRPAPVSAPPPAVTQNAGGATSQAGGLRRVRFRVRHQWRFFGRLTVVERLVLRGIPAGSRVDVRCLGRSCPFRRWTRGGVRSVDLKRIFRGRRIRVGTRIEIRVTKRGLNGTVLTFTTRGGAVPRVSQACLKPGTSRPTRRC
jgi:Concanavalin A-like lectin/glucanases superfamily